MPKALLVKGTGELFRLASTDIFTLHSIKEGVRVDCYNALLKETRKGKRTYDKTVTFVFNPSLHQVGDKPSDSVLDNEKRRAKELLCWKYHRGRCSPPPYEAEQVQQVKSISSDPSWGERELLRVSRLALENLQTPGKFDKTKLSLLAFDLDNVLGWFRRRARTAVNRGALDGTADGEKAGNP
jgi:hypothetical protein